MSLPEGHRVCVVGAGVAGVSAALRLQEKGYEVTVYEKRDRIGGKCYTREIEAGGKTVYCELGASVVAVSYRNLLRFADMLGERTIKAWPYQVLQGSGKIVSFRDHYWPRGRIFRLTSQFLKYTYLVRRFYRRHVSKTGYKDNIPDEYLVTFSQYCKKNRMEDLMRWFDLPLRAWGYGEPGEIPAWYVFGEIDFLGMLGVLITVTFGTSRFVKSLEHGYGNLVRRLAEAEGLNVHTGAEVSSIERRSDGVTVTSPRGAEEFDNVVISSPQVASLFSNPSEAESTFLRDIVYVPYSTTLCTLGRAVGAKLVVAQNLNKVNAVKMIAAQGGGSSVVVCYAGIDEDTTEADVREMVTRDLESLEMDLLEIHEAAVWKDYFPHFSTYDAYKALLASQGENRTIYVGAINKFEFIESAIVSSINLVDEHFPDRIPARGERRYITV